MPAVTALMTPAEVATYLGVKPKTLEGWRYKRTGPPFIKRGRVVRYRADALQEWLDQSEVATSA
ncbi:helix-turn-helix domain-containing protein [Brachybacterium kimchii]|uniref:Helix-turn-helix domain-containing protein n=1 Tax=Brachybacterium kimchii TaxID=2942909 RepID=A0ABY4N4F6_9MICO|nr:helix-turn-helix domain-containing protein [Brachybacterium kimchii]UQN29448.1 helix-turn-helix domain-containing protein [Brachybacterium kimchii]